MSTRPALQPPTAWSYPLPTRHGLDNGMDILVHRVPGQRVISANLVFDLPLTAEDPAIEGVATVCARTLDEGTVDHPGDTFAEALETEGAALVASQGQSSLQVMIDVPATRFAPALELLAEGVRRPELTDADINRHVALRLAELDQLMANSAHLSSWAFRNAVFSPEIRAQRLPAGEPDTVRAITPHQVREFHRRHYGPRGATLVLAGDFPGDPVPLAAQAFSTWVNPDQAEPRHEDCTPAAPTAILIDRPGSVQADVRLGGLGVDRHDARWPDFQVGSYAVGGAFLSRLNKVLREERGYTYGVSLQNAPMRSGGTYTVAGSFRTEVVAPALEEARALLDISGCPIRPDEVTDAVNYFAGVSPLRYATAEGIADQTASIVAQGLALDYVNTYLSGIRAATPESASRAYADIVDLTALTLIVVGDAEALAPALGDAGFPITVR